MIAQAGIDKKLSSRSQAIAAIPPAEFEHIIAESKEGVTQKRVALAKVGFHRVSPLAHKSGKTRAAGRQKPVPTGNRFLRHWTRLESTESWRRGAGPGRGRNFPARLRRLPAGACYGATASTAPRLCRDMAGEMPQPIGERGDGPGRGEGFPHGFNRFRREQEPPLYLFASQLAFRYPPGEGGGMLAEILCRRRCAHAALGRGRGWIGYGIARSDDAGALGGR